MADIQTDPELPNLVPSGSYIVFLSVVCVSFGFGFDWISAGVLWNGFVHFLVSDLVLGMGEEYRGLWGRW